jgi:O-antigen/teichoic acid export membrane protein
MSPALASAPSSRSLFKSIAQGSSLYSVAMLGQRLASIILLPITTRFLTPAEYGMLDLLEQLFGVLGFLVGANFSAALGFFYFKEKSEEARRPVVGTTMIGAAAIGVLATLVCWPFAAPLSRLVFGSAMAANYLRLVFITFAPSFLLEALFSWLRVTDRPAMYVIGSLVRTGVTIIGTVVLLALLRMRAWGVLSTSLSAVVLTAALLSVYCFRSQRPAFDRRVFTRMVRFSAPIGLGSIGMFIIHFGDRFILPHYRSLNDLGIYVLAYKFGMLLSFVYSSFQSYWSAQVFQIMRRDDAETVFARLFTYVMLGLSFCSLGLVVGSHPVLTALAAPAFRGAVDLVPVIVAAYFLRAIGDFLRCLFMEAGRPGYYATCSWIGSIACLAGYLILIPKYGIWGAAVATALAFLATATITAVWTYRLKRYRVEGARIAKIVLALAAGLAPYILFRSSLLAVQVGTAALSVAAFLLALWVLRFPTPGEIETGRSALHTIAARMSRFVARGHGDANAQT